MAGILGLDTSNYTTSAAVYDTKERRLYGEKKLLPVKEGELGLRQSDAVFHHVRQLPERIKRLREQYEGSLQAVAASDRPRQTQGSYMPVSYTHLVVLTLDADIQKITERVAKNYIQKGAVLVMEPSSGQILSMVSLPDYQPRCV